MIQSVLEEKGERNQSLNVDLLSMINITFDLPRIQITENFLGEHLEP